MTDVINNVKNFIKKHWIAIWLVVIILLLVSSFSYAAYTNLNSVKRVVSVKGGAGTRFSSNYLNLTEKEKTSYSTKNISISKENETSIFEIDIFNYAQNDPSKVNENDINYTLNFTLEPSTATGLTVSYGEMSSGDSNGSVTISDQKLKGGEKSINKYTITVPKSFISDNVKLTVTAVPDESSYGATDSMKLARVFSFAEYTQSVSGWTGSFLEQTTENYDGFNYIMKGQGKGTVTLEWETSQLEINNVFLKENNLTVTTSEGKSKIELLVDSDKKNRYDIQFYKTKTGSYENLPTIICNYTHE